MKYFTTEDRKALKRADDDLSSLDRAILTKCKEGLNIIRVLKSGKPYYNKHGSRMFATTDDILAEVRKLIRLELLERR